MTAVGKRLNRQKLRQARKAKGLSLMDIAESINYSIETVKEWQYKDKHGVSKQGMDLLTKLLEVSEDYLIEI